LALRAALQSQKLFRHIGPQPDSRARWDEFRNKLQTFLAFEYMDLHLGVAVSRELPLHQLISKAEMPGPQHAAFAIEGSGYYLMKSRIAGASGAEPLASSGLLAHFPPRVLVMLHAGFGLALAEWYLGAADEDASG